VRNMAHIEMPDWSLWRTLRQVNLTAGRGEAVCLIHPSVYKALRDAGWSDDQINRHLDSHLMWDDADIAVELVYSLDHYALVGDEGQPLIEADLEPEPEPQLALMFTAQFSRAGFAAEQHAYIYSAFNISPLRELIEREMQAGAVYEDETDSDEVVGIDAFDAFVATASAGTTFEVANPASRDRVIVTCVAIH